MADLVLVAQTGPAKRLIKKLHRNLTPESMDRVVRVSAFKIHAKLVVATPKKWTGQTRKGWTVTFAGASHYSVWNRSRVMLWLERGTPSRKPVKAKALFIPLNRKMALAGSKALKKRNHRYIYGVDYILRKSVKGAKAMHIVRDFLPTGERILFNEMRSFIREIASS